MKIIEKEYNVETGEETIIEREETVEEKNRREANQAAFAAKQVEAAAKEAARQALLNKLGITAEEAKLLLS